MPTAQHSYLRTKIVKAIEARGWLVLGDHAGKPDLLVCAEGKLIGVEVKTGGADLEPGQRAYVRRINQAGGLAFVARAVEQAILVIQQHVRKPMGVMEQIAEELRGIRIALQSLNLDALPGPNPDTAPTFRTPAGQPALSPEDRAKNAAQSVEEAPLEVQPARRGRGRPRKDAATDVTETPQEQAESDLDSLFADLDL